jgi:4-amino-4-deoxy-L-arabinose transferase-like glycosyltransferase
VKSALNSNRALAALVAGFVILGTTYSIVTPLFEAGDEIWHYPYVQFLASGHGLPVQDPARRELWQQEGGQPPMYYVLAAAATFWIDTGDLPERLWRNPYAKIGIPLAFGNKNLIVHTSAENFPWQNTTLAVHLIRLLSVLLSAGTVVLTYLLAKEIYLRPALPPEGGSASFSSSLANEEQRRVALFASALVAFNPMFLFISASVNNDSLAIVLASLALLLVVQLVTRGMDKRRSLLLGIVCGLGALTKVSDLALLPLALLVVLWQGWRISQRKGESRRVRAIVSTLTVPALSIAVPTLLLAGWWYVRNYLLYGDALAFNVWLKIAGGRSTPATLLGLVSEFQGFRISFWGNFGGVNLIAPDWVYVLLDVISLMAPVGLAVGAWRRKLPKLLWIPGVWLIVVFAGLVRWTLMTYASQGRLIFPAISAVAILMASGLSNLWPGGSRSRRLVGHELGIQTSNLAISIFLLAFATAAPFLIIAPAYTLPPILPVDARAPNPVNITYTANDARPELVGYEIGRSVRAGEELPLTLYWRAATGVDRDLYVYIHLYDAAGESIGQWEAFPGNGLYPTRLWRPDEMIVDSYRIPVASQAVGPQVGRVEAGLTPVGSTVPLPAFNPSGESIVPTIARFKIAAPPTNNPPRPTLFEFGRQFEAVNIHFGGARGGRVFEIDPGNPSDTPMFGGDILRVALTLRASTLPDGDYTVFVHLVDSKGVIVEQLDMPPGGAGYPTSFWDSGEEVDNQYDLTLRDDIPPGNYQVEVGLYRSGGGARLPVTGSAIGDLRTASDHLLLSPLPIGK